MSIMMTVYVKSGCPACVKLKQILDHFGVVYKIVSLDDPITKSEFILSHPTVKSMPYYEGQMMTFNS